MITLRPHHGLCIRFFIGKGYSDSFVANMKTVIRRLKENEQVTISLRSSIDVICKHCPHNQIEGCQSGQKVIDYDSKCLSLCKLKEGDILTWVEFQKKIEKNIIAKGLLKEVCVGCQWISLCDGESQSTSLGILSME